MDENLGVEDFTELMSIGFRKNVLGYSSDQQDLTRYK